MTGDAEAGRRVDAGTFACIALLFVLGVGLRVVALGRGGLWGDEVFSASFAQLSGIGTVLAVLLLDVHPPLYYLQLNAWGLAGHGDLWFLLNSVFWSTGTLLAVFLGVRRKFGLRCALAALALCAVSGSEIYFAHELRMYAMYSCLCVLAWIAADRFRADSRLRTALPLVLLLVAMGAIHGASVMGASAVLLYASPAVNAPEPRHRLRNWIIVSVVVACTYLPWMVNGSLRQISHAAPPSIAGVSHTVAGWLIGYGAIPVSLPGLGVALALLACLLAAVLAVPSLLRLALCFVAWPLLFGTLLCLLVQPIWLDRTFAFCAPFVAVVLGVALGRVGQGASGRQWPGYIAAAAVAGWVMAGCWLGYRQVTVIYKPDRYDLLAAYLRGAVRDGEIIYAPEGPTFWGVSRYLVGPDWGSILQVQDPADLARLRRWHWVTGVFGDEALQRNALSPRTRRLDGFRVPVFTGFSPLPQPRAGQVIWFIDSVGTSREIDLPVCAGHYPQPVEFGRLRAFRVQCPGGA